MWIACYAGNALRFPSAGHRLLRSLHGVDSEFSQTKTAIGMLHSKTPVDQISAMRDDSANAFSR